MVSEGLAVLVADGANIVEFAMYGMPDDVLVGIERELDVDLCHVVRIAARIDAEHFLPRRILYHLDVAGVVVSIEDEVESVDR